VLTDVAIKSAIRAAKTAQKPIKRFDQGGLFVLVTPGGSALWRLKYQFEGREKLIGLGTYPDTNLKLARDKRDQARRMLAEGKNPSAERQATKAAHANDFKTIAEGWLNGQKQLEAETVGRIRDRLSTWIYGTLGSRAISSIKPIDLLPLLRKVEAAGRHETAHRVRSDVSRVLRHGVSTGRCERDITVDLRGALAPARVRHFAALTDPVKVGELMRAIWGYRGQPVVEIALKLAPYLFVRPGELRSAEWSEIDLAAKEWRIPAAKTKMRRLHVVPLAAQALSLFEDLKVHSGGGRLCFPTVQDPTRPMSENTLNACLRRLGYGKDEMTSHGFRSIASSLLNEQGWAPDLIERQLAHAEQNATRDAYNRAAHLPARRKMMAGWADYLDSLRLGGTNVVVGIRRA
jgi:integrase